MFLKCSRRNKDGKEHRSWSVVESCRTSKGVVQRHVLYLGEISGEQQSAWTRTLEAFDEREQRPRQLLLGEPPQSAQTLEGVRLCLAKMRLERPRQWGACWLADYFWQELNLDSFFSEHLGVSREGTDWEKVLRILVIYRLLSPGSEWRLHREWFRRSALDSLLNTDLRAVADDTLYRCHDLLLAHKEDLFAHLRQRWVDLFNAQFDVVLYDLTSTYFECAVPDDETDPRRFGYSRDKRSDCVQVVLALIVTPEGLPLAYEMLPGNTLDKTTLATMLALLAKRHGAARRIWLMDRGIPTEETLACMRASTPPVNYLVGTPKARVKRMESQLQELPWEEVRCKVRVKKIAEDNETYIYAESAARKDKERSMLRHSLHNYLSRLAALKTLKIPLSRDEMLLRLGQAKERAGRAPCGHVRVEVAADGKLSYKLDWEKVRQSYRRAGGYLLRTNLGEKSGEELWRYYMQLVFVEESFRTLKSDLNLRPVYHQKPGRIEAHLHITFLSYCLLVTLKQRLRGHSSGLTPRSVLEKLSQIQQLEVLIPTEDGRELRLERRTQPDADARLVLEKLGLKLPEEGPPRLGEIGEVKG
jgi:transposase